MKKILFCAAAMAVALSSCSKNEMDNNAIDPSNAIGFGTYYSNSVSRATTTDFADDAKFGVSAYFTEGNAFATTATANTYSFMSNQAVTYDGADWSYSPLKYWPNDTNDQVSFFAVSDNTETVPATLSTTDDMPSFTLTGTAAPKDILVASALNKKKSEGDVEFVFQHALAGIVMNAFVSTDGTGNTVDANTTVTITELSINYGKMQVNGGTFSYTASGTPVGSWTNLANLESTEDDYVVSYKGVSDAGYVLANAGTVTKDIVNAYIVPNTTNTATVTVKYTVATKVAADSTNANDSSVDNVATFTITPATINTLYTYDIKISLTGVVVSGTISSDWDTTDASFDVVVENSTPSAAAKTPTL